MSEDKVTPVPHPKGTPKRMRPRILRISYYLVAFLAVLHILTGLYVYYETVVLSRAASTLSLQPPSLDAVIEFFSGIFGVVAAFGLRRLAYWGGLSIAVFGVFEFWNSSLLADIITFGLYTTLGITLTSSLQIITLIFQVLSVLVIISSVISMLGIRSHRRIAGLMKG